MQANRPILPKRLTPGDTVAIVSISWGGPAAFPALFELGIKNLSEYFNLSVIEYPTARMSNDELYRNPGLRAEDVNRAFQDDRVDAVISSIGGSDSVRILPFLDTDTILANPKIMMGYSDTTTVLGSMSLAGMVTLYGPSVMGGIAQIQSMPTGYLEHLRRFLFDGTAGYRYGWYDTWSDGYPDWGNQASLGRVLNKQENKRGWLWLQGSGVHQGRLWGGCIEVLEFLKGTEFWPTKDFWSDRIVFFETSEEKPPVKQIVYMLRNYGVQGLFDRAAAIFVGRPKAYSEAEKNDLYAALRKTIGQEFGCPDLPIIANMDFGHTDPKIVLPLGALVRVDCAESSITVIEEFTAE